MARNPVFPYSTLAFNGERSLKPVPGRSNTNDSKSGAQRGVGSCRTIEILGAKPKLKHLQSIGDDNIPAIYLRLRARSRAPWHLLANIPSAPVLPRPCKQSHAQFLTRAHGVTAYAGDDSLCSVELPLLGMMPKKSTYTHGRSLPTKRVQSPMLRDHITGVDRRLNFYLLLLKSSASSAPGIWYLDFRVWNRYITPLYFFELPVIVFLSSSSSGTSIPVLLQILNIRLMIAPPPALSQICFRLN